jgi:BNR repeat-like domain/Fibronectin type III domain
MTYREGRTARRARRVVVALAVMAAAAIVPFSASDAATPSGGTVSATNTSVSWSGGLMVATGGGCDGATDTSCDLYKLTVQPPGYSFQVRIVLQPVGDWDLSVYAPDGGLIGGSGNGPNVAEVFTLSNPAAGTYTVAAAPFAPLVGADGNSYTASATVVPWTAPPGSSGGASITYENYAAPGGLGTDAGEPSIGANWKSGNVMFQAGLQALRVTFDDSSSPATASWQNVSFPTASRASLDPIGYMDRVTGRWFSSQLSGTTSLAAVTDNDGASWLPSEGGPGNGGVDHQTIGGGPYAAPAPPTATYPHAFYYCSQDLVAALCARSDNGGISFNPATPIYTSECGGLHGHVKVAPDGTVYVPNRGCNGYQAVVVSTDNGSTWSVKPVPGSSTGSWDPSVAIASDNTAYLGYGDGDGHPRVAVSHDHGTTWTNIRDVGTSVGVVQTAFPAMVAGDGDRAAFAFLGTTTSAAGAFGDDPNWPGVWHLYVATTYDGGNTWTTVDATPYDAVQRGTICGGGFGGACDTNNTRNLLDFMDATLDSKGRVLVGYADGCLSTCVTGGTTTRSALATIARQVDGKGLLSQYDVNTVPSAPTLSGKAGSSSRPTNVLSWKAPFDGGSPITGYRLYRKTSASAYSLLASLSATATSYTDKVKPKTAYTYKLTAVNANGEGAASNEVTPH